MESVLKCQSAPGRRKPLFFRDSIGRRKPPLAPAPLGTSPVGSPRQKTDGSPFRYGGFRAASCAHYNYHGFGVASRAGRPH